MCKRSIQRKCKKGTLTRLSYLENENKTTDKNVGKTAMRYSTVRIDEAQSPVPQALQFFS